MNILKAVLSIKREKSGRRSKMVLDKGYVQVYTGNGKGKSSASIGVSLRMLCNGGKVFMGEFMKGQGSSEIKAMEKFPNYEVEQFGLPKFVMNEPSEEDKANARKGFERMKEVLMSGEYDLVIFDEINSTIFYGMVEPEELIELLTQKPEKTEVILTGRNADPKIIEFADLVTEMREIKHYYQKGVMARKGIES